MAERSNEFYSNVPDTLSGEERKDLLKKYFQQGKQQACENMLKPEHLNFLVKEMEALGIANIKISELPVNIPRHQGVLDKIYELYLDYSLLQATVFDFDNDDHALFHAFTSVRANCWMSLLQQLADMEALRSNEQLPQARLLEDESKLETSFFLIRTQFRERLGELAILLPSMRCFIEEDLRGWGMISPIHLPFVSMEQRRTWGGWNCSEELAIVDQRLFWATHCAVHRCLVPKKYRPCDQHKTVEEFLQVTEAPKSGVQALKPLCTKCCNRRYTQFH
jgi:hypothetical protein